MGWMKWITCRVKGLMLLQGYYRYALLYCTSAKGINSVIRDYVYTIEETADLMEVNRSTVYRWLRAGRLPGENIGGVVLIPRWAVEMVQAERDAKAARRRPKGPSQAQVEA